MSREYASSAAEITKAVDMLPGLTVSLRITAIASTGSISMLTFKKPSLSPRLTARIL